MGKEGFRAQYSPRKFRNPIAELGKRVGARVEKISNSLSSEVKYRQRRAEMRRKVQPYDKTVKSLLRSVAKETMNPRERNSSSIKTVYSGSFFAWTLEYTYRFLSEVERKPYSKIEFEKGEFCVTRYKLTTENLYHLRDLLVKRTGRKVKIDNFVGRVEETRPMDSGGPGFGGSL